MSKSYSPKSPDKSKVPMGINFFYASQRLTWYRAVDLAQSLRKGNKFRKSGPGMAVFPVKFCLQDFIPLIRINEGSTGFCDISRSL